MLIEKGEYINLIDEFEEMETKEAIFCKMVDKLEADIQAKIYCEENRVDVNDSRNAELLKNEKIEKMIFSGNKTMADFFVESDRPIFTDKNFLDIAEYVKNNDLYNLDKNRFNRR